MNETIPSLPGLSPVAGKEMCARFDGGRLSSDGSVLLLREIERRLGICDLLASCMTDARNPASTTHSYAGMIRARMFAIACGDEDCDDLDTLRFDPAFKLACGRLSETGDDLMSQRPCRDRRGHQSAGPRRRPWRHSAQTYPEPQFTLPDPPAPTAKSAQIHSAVGAAGQILAIQMNSHRTATTLPPSNPHRPNRPHRRA